MAWEQMAITVGVTAAKQFFETVNKRKDERISIGLSVGYFYNFLDPVSDRINAGEFKLHKNQDDKEPQVFDTDNIKLTVIMPRKLDVFSFKACEDEFKKYNKGSIYLNRNSRWYGINYGFSETAVGKELEIVDLARPVMAVKQYYEQVRKSDTVNGAQKWQADQLSEIAAFKESLKRLQELGYGVLVNKLHFREIG